MEFPDRIWRALSALNATQPITWTIQVKDEGGVQLTVELGEKKQPPSRRGSTFRGGNSSHTGPHTKEGDENYLLDVKKKTRRKKGPSARRRDARRLTVFLERKRKEKEEKEREKSINHSTPQTPGAPKPNPDISSEEVMPEDCGSLEVTLTSTPTRSSHEDGMEGESMSFVNEEESADASLNSSVPRSLSLSDLNPEKESDGSESEEEPWKEDLEQHMVGVRKNWDSLGCSNMAGLEQQLNYEKELWISENKGKYTNIAARARPYEPKKKTKPIQTTPPKKDSPSQPPPKKKKKNKHRN